MTEPLLRLLAWLSPSMPVGAFSYSHGLEAAVEEGLVSDAGTLHAYIDMALRHGAARTDAIWLRASHIATIEAAFEGQRLDEIVAFAAALRGTPELALESAQPGRALLRVLLAAWPSPALDHLNSTCRTLGIEPPYACVLGVASAAHAIPLGDMLAAFLHAFVANLVSAGVRLIPLGQTDGQRVIAALERAIDRMARETLEAGLDDLGAATPMIDLLSIAHETQHTRLFRS